MSEATVQPFHFSRPVYQLERRVERLRKLRALYEQKLFAIEAKLRELEDLIRL